MVRRIIVEVAASSPHAMGSAGNPSPPPLPGCTYDDGFPAVELPGTGPASFVVRGGCEDDDLDDLLAGAGAEPRVLGVFADVRVEAFSTRGEARASEGGDRGEARAKRASEGGDRGEARAKRASEGGDATATACGGDPPIGTARDVAAAVGVEALQAGGMDGRDVLVAIVDSGINLAYLRRRGLSPALDAARSWSPEPGPRPGEGSVDHGTMVAFDALIAAPHCTLLDIALLRSQEEGDTAMAGFLSDAVRAYAHLLGILRDAGSDAGPMVVTNSWGMFHPSWDFPVGHPGNYSDNPGHPFNRIVGTLERTGADLLFAAGNCGVDCPDGRCEGVTERTIYGANSHPQVLCVGGVTVTGERVGYSAIGPGRLAARKPDLCGYTHFAGSGVYPADGGTSAATPVVAGVVAALRSRLPLDPGDPTTSPAAVRDLLTRTATPAGPEGYDPAYGWGIVNGAGALDALPA